MGFYHVEIIEEYLKLSSEPVTKAKISKDLGLNYNTVSSTLEFLEKEKRVEVFKKLVTVEKYGIREKD